jgi:hypothetical protein
MSSKYDDDNDEKDTDDREEERGGPSDSEEKDYYEEGKSSANKVLADEELISKVQEFFFADTTLTKTFEAFVKENASIIDLDSVESNEFKLEYTNIYEEFKSIFETKIEGYIENELGSSVQQFYKVLQEKTEEDVNSNEAIFGQILLAVCDFDVFMVMMKEEAQMLSRK